MTLQQNIFFHPSTEVTVRQFHVRAVAGVRAHDLLRASIPPKSATVVAVAAMAPQSVR